MYISGSPKPAIFIEGGIHAREWISPATVTFIIRELVTNPKYIKIKISVTICVKIKYFSYRDLITKFDWIIMPLVNPDGYAYSHKEVILSSDWSRVIILASDWSYSHTEVTEEIFAISSSQKNTKQRIPTGVKG